MPSTYAPEGSEFRVNTYTAQSQHQPSITALSDGGFVVSWTSDNQDGSGPGIYAQRFGADGSAVGGEFLVNTTTTNIQQQPSITALSDGGFVVSWMSFGQDGSGGSYGIYAQRFGADGGAVGGEFLVNTTTALDQLWPSITALSDGGFLVSWTSHGQDGSGYGIYAQRYGADGSAVGGEFLVNTTTVLDQLQPSITALSDGGFGVSWISASQDGSGYGIYAQRFDADGSAVGGEFRVNTTTFSDQVEPSITALSDGGFVVSWTSSGQDGSIGGIYAQRFGADGSAVGGEFRVNTTTYDNQLQPSITALPDGGFVVSWTSFGQDGSGYGIYAQRYGADGGAVGGEFLVNTTMANSQEQPSITALSDGGFVISWHSLNQDGGGWGIYAQRFAPAFEGTAGNDSESGFSGDDTINGYAGNDYLAGRAGNDTLNGGDGSDRLEGGDGNDTLDGGDGYDEAVYINATSGVTLDLSLTTSQDTGGAGIDTLTSIENVAGSEFADTITGNDSNNLLDGRAGNDSLTGGVGNDRLRGGTGADTMVGGTGDDSYEVDDAGDVVSELASEGTGDRVDSSISYTLGENVERLTLTGSSAIDGTGNALNNVIIGNSGANTLTGGAGNDALNGMAGADTLMGGIGSDIYTIDNVGDVVTENLSEGSDRVNSSISYTLAANVENLTLTGTAAINGTGNTLNNAITGNSGANTLAGGAGNDTLNGMAGADTLIGGIGNDIYTIDNVGDVVTENLSEGTDRVNSSISYTLVANVENLTLTGAAVINGTGNSLANIITGNAAANILNGGDGADTLNGGAGNDVINGGVGNDVLNGGIGSDTLNGGLGLDLFRFDTALSAVNNVDTINGFSVADDTFQLDDDIFTAIGAVGALTGSAFRAGTAAADADDRIIYDSATGRIYYDADGSGAGAQVLFAQVAAGVALTNADFLIVG